MKNHKSACPCGNSQAYEACCEPLHKGSCQAETAEQLMRSRYSAFVNGQSDYLLTTWHASTRPPLVELDPDQQWIGLRILSTRNGGNQDAEGEVEFVAGYKLNGRAYKLHERSRFSREAGRWVYVDGWFPGG